MKYLKKSHFISGFFLFEGMYKETNVNKIKGDNNGKKTRQ